MITKADFLSLAKREIDLCKHLYERIPPGRMDWRPGPNMRSTLELLRYLTYCGLSPVWRAVNDDWKSDPGLAKATEAMKAEEFPGRMDDQLRRIEELLAPVGEQQLLARDCHPPMLGTVKMGVVLITSSLRFLTAYRHQLFLHAKVSGAADLTTWNNWWGQDAPPPAQG